MDFLADQKRKWELLRLNLLSRSASDRYSINNDWTNAISLFDEVINYRYINPINTIINIRNNIGEGLFIIHSQVILIEILAAFQQGKIYKKDCNTGFYYDNAFIYINFIKNESLFSDVFEEINYYYYNDTTSNKGYMDFYFNVRCGLIHEGVLKTDWDVNTHKYDVINDLRFIKIENNKRVIYRNILQTVIEEYLKNYIGLLNESIDGDIRKKFARRLDCLFNITDEYHRW